MRLQMHFSLFPTVDSFLQVDCECITCTTDMWTTRDNRFTFIALTGHWIGRDWQLKCVLLDFIQVQSLHTGEHLAGLLLETMRRLGILHKVSFEMVFSILLAIVISQLLVRIPAHCRPN